MTHFTQDGIVIDHDFTIGTPPPASNEGSSPEQCAFALFVSIIEMQGRVLNDDERTLARTFWCAGMHHLSTQPTPKRPSLLRRIALWLT